ncbi:hypothetical protein CSIM01_02407 [Colletotrichum simmondsii]|uniref:Cyanovirin-N domain-containing protein n=1 Tax=Colletotrichum simmondsii TaxID=703756 RepID=A0A135S7F9_9PEZI|nr:hypothetical protein CSIM01_02407 [Colletotrichum simmondsii]
MKVYNIIAGLAFVGFAAAAGPDCPEHSDCMQKDCINFDLNKQVTNVDDRRTSSVLSADCPNRKKGAKKGERVATTLDLRKCIMSTVNGLLWQKKSSHSHAQILAVF